MVSLAAKASGRALGLVVLTLCASNAFPAESAPKLQPNQNGYQPATGFVPTAAVALAVARSMLVPIYGKQALASQEPLTARLVNEIWIVEGHLPPNTDGGEVDFRISKSDGRVTYLAFGK